MGANCYARVLELHMTAHVFYASMPTHALYANNRLFDQQTSEQLSLNKCSFLCGRHAALNYHVLYRVLIDQNNVTVT